MGTAIAEPKCRVDWIVVFDDPDEGEPIHIPEAPFDLEEYSPSGAMRVAQYTMPGLVISTYGKMLNRVPRVVAVTNPEGERYLVVNNRLSDDPEVRTWTAVFEGTAESDTDEYSEGGMRLGGIEAAYLIDAFAQAQEVFRKWTDEASTSWRQYHSYSLTAVIDADGVRHEVK